MTASSNFSDSCSPLPLALTEVHNHHQRRHRRRCLVTCLTCLLLFLLLILTILILAFTVFKSKDLTITLVSAAVSGLSQRVTSSPTVHMDLNVTVDLLFSVYNPNRVSFAHDPGTCLLSYRGDEVGDADVPGGRMPARGSEEIHVRLTLEEGKLSGELGRELMEDVMAGGEVVFGTCTRIRGKVTFLGFLKFHVRSATECRITVGVAEMKVTSQECKKTKP